MRFFGKRSVSSALGTCLTIAWYGGIVLLIMAFWTICVLLFVDQRRLQESLLNSPGLSFQVDSDFLTIKFPNTVLKGTRVFTGFMAAASVDLGFGLAIIFQLKRIFATLRAGVVFKEESSKRIRMIGFLILAGALVKGVVSGLIGVSVLRDISLSGATIEASFRVSFESIFTGLVILVLGEIFRHGARLQAEQDLTI